MDVPQFELEQQYGLDRRRLLNRLTLGTGVACGLQLHLKDKGICVCPGVAIDGHGREIVVPESVLVDPWIVGDPGKTSELPRNVAHTVYLCASYAECLADPIPVAVTDGCRSDEAIELGTIVESFRIEIHEGLPPDVKRPTLADAVARLDHASCAAPGPDCVVLGIASLAADGTVADIKMQIGRRAVVGTDLLLDIVLALAAQLATASTPASSPSTPGKELP
jgi:hypothetical protein